MPSISVPTAIIGASVIGGASMAIGANSAANSQKNAAAQASKTQMDMYGQNKALLQPWSDQGLEAYGTLNHLLGVGGNSDTMQSTLEGLPGYQFTRDQGLKATQSGYAAKGLGSSGGALKGAANYATGLANSQYGTYVNELQSSANTGQGAANALAGFGANAASGVAGNQIGAGNAAAAAANATGSAFGNAAGNLGQYYTLKNLLDSNNTATQTDPNFFYGAGGG